MIHHDASAHRRCCAEAQARGIRGGGNPPGKMDDFCETAEKAMLRRKVSLSEEEKDKLHNIYKTC